MKDIEDAFQNLTQRILDEDHISFDDRETKIITEFYGLCQTRANRRELPHQHLKVNGMCGVRRSLDDLEYLEKNNIMSFRPDGVVAMRELMPCLILGDIERINEELEGKAWGVLRSVEREFCVPDIISRGIIPLTPQIALAVGISSDTITNDSVALINRTICGTAWQYVFARDLGACPGIPHPI